MKLKSLFIEAFDAIIVNRTRAALTLMGIIIGVGSVVTAVSVGNGAKTVIGELLGSYGSNTLLVLPNQAAMRESNWRYRAQEISRDDIRMINTQADAVRAVTPQIEFESQVSYKGRTEEMRFVGTLHYFLEAQGVEIERGRSLRSEDDMYLRKVVVLGHDIADSLFGDEDPIGKFVKFVDSTECEVIGVLTREEKSFISTVSEFDTTTNNSIFAPASTLGRTIGSSFIYFLIGDAVSTDRIEEAKRQILNILLMNHGRWDGKYEKFVVQEMGAILDTIDTVTGTITAFISIIAGIALVVAGIGIMNIMLVSVKERTREIGTRKALGATQSSILNQFVVETLVLCGGGGLLGVALAAFLVHLIASIWNWPALISFQVIRLSVILSLCTGLVFGLYPSSKAARMDPVEALRYE